MGAKEGSPPWGIVGGARDPGFQPCRVPSPICKEEGPGGAGILGGPALCQLLILHRSVLFTSTFLASSLCFQIASQSWSTRVDTSWLPWLSATVKLSNVELCMALSTHSQIRLHVAGATDVKDTREEKLFQTLSDPCHKAPWACHFALNEHMLTTHLPVTYQLPDFALSSRKRWGTHHLSVRNEEPVIQQEHRDVADMTERAGAPE